MNKNSIHLDEDQLICAIVDERDMAASVQDHLSKCTICQAGKRQLEQDLGYLGRMAEVAAPLSTQNIILDHRERPGVWSRQVAFAAGFAIIFLIVALWWSLPLETNREETMAKLAQEIEEDRKFMGQIYELEEYIMPDVYSVLTGEDTGFYYNDLMEFLTPLQENQDSAQNSKFISIT